MREDITLLQAQNARLRSKVDAFARGDTFLYLREEDQEKAACQLPDADLVKWVRWALVQADRLYEDSADKKQRSVAEVVAMHGVISLAKLIADSGAETGSFTVEGASWPGRPDGSGGDWRVTIERLPAPPAEAGREVGDG
jgi:hypothetical protein